MKALLELRALTDNPAIEAAIDTYTAAPGPLPSSDALGLESPV